MKFFLMALVSFMLLSSGSFAADVSKFATVSEMVEEFGDYAKDNNTFKVLKSEPLHIQLAEAKKVFQAWEAMNCCVNPLYQEQTWRATK